LTESSVEGGLAWR